MLQRIDSPRIYAEVVRQIRGLIKNGAIKPGERLPTERELADQLGVSRPSVREALSALEVLGYVKSRPGAGTFVQVTLPADSRDEELGRILDDLSPSEIIEARLFVETGTAFLAATRRTPAESATLRQIIEQMVEAVESGRSYAHVIDCEFHLAIARASHNALLITIMETTAERMMDRVWRMLRDRNLDIPGRARFYLLQHQTIFAAIEAGDADQARLAMKDHVSQVAEDLMGDPFLVGRLIDNPVFP